MNQSEVVELRCLKVRSGGRIILDVDFLRIEAGGMVALIGPNGAGKTTLLKSCLGLVRNAEGWITVLGENVFSLRGKQLAAFRRRVGCVPQMLPGRSEFPITVREVVTTGRTARAGLWRRLSHEDRRTVDEWLERLGLLPVADRPFAAISGGEQRKTIIARAMVQEPELLLLDEPTANLDLGWRETVVDTIQQIHIQTGISVVLVCHELEVLPPGCRRVIAIESGRLIADGMPEEVLTEAFIRKLYGPGFGVWHGHGRHALLPTIGVND
ncbi:MAG: ABC transporter ATP-binding protein [Verrucomicrobiae bacterium]|nr:ABC transporter ATP-binding protein [Verrucomicrobiae bacterium]